ncbi:MAG: sigma-70 family RNA polymerase sigma factor [Candidatus Poribacteria bacterium]|nr:sigma-70 family RNA polymerase sigma factor [Candidatus Poribacteria bacterium]
MIAERGPHFSAKCPFYISPDDPLSATASIEKCVRCVTHGIPALEGLSQDFQQTAFLTVLEETPNYDPEHPSRASFITFIKSKVCCSLWTQRRKELRYIPCLSDDADSDDADLLEETHPTNPLVAALQASARLSESLEDEVMQTIEIEQFRKCLPELLARLTASERTLVRLKYFQDASGVDMASALGVSASRISQLTKTALTKLRKAYCRVVEKSVF